MGFVLHVKFRIYQVFSGVHVKFKAIREALLILEQKPADLCSLIIESSWFTWRHFLRKIGEDIPMLDFEKAD